MRSVSVKKAVGFRWLVESLAAQADQQRWSLVDWQNLLVKLHAMTSVGEAWEHQDFALAARRYVQRRIRTMRQSA